LLIIDHQNGIQRLSIINKGSKRERKGNTYLREGALSQKREVWRKKARSASEEN
jgi:hypothetical protein